ncbi:MAG: carboxypeptidase-like regulatory domain-containing protein [Longimicrobiales bacterium]|nr:carboxypeptidase-like regulatory domain-containing protein [Longimicrobiales bacterium]
MRRGICTTLLLLALTSLPASAQVVIGDVTEAGTGRPLAGAWIALVDSAGAEVDATVADYDGGFTLRAATPGHYDVIASLPGLALFGIEPVSSPVELIDGATRRLLIELDPRAGLATACEGVTDPIAVHGTVRDVASGEGLAGAPLMVTVSADARDVSDTGSGTGIPITTDERGIFAACVPSSGDAEWVAVAIDAPGADPPRMTHLLSGVPLVRTDLEVDGAALDDARMERALASLGVSESSGVPASIASAGGITQTTGEGSGGATTIRGRVVNADDDRGIEAATVRLLSEEGEILAATHADATGAFTLPPPVPGPVVVTVDALGYSGRSDRVSYDGRSMILEIRVARAPIALEGLEVEVERRSDYLERTGFYHRQRFGFGNFLDVEAMDVSRILTTGQLLVRMPGTSMTPGGEPYFPRHGSCLPMIVVDGLTVRTTTSPSSIDAFRDVAPRANEISAIEIYRSSTFAPVEWKSSANNCGMIMIWTKH